MKLLLDIKSNYLGNWHRNPPDTEACSLTIRKSFTSCTSDWTSKVKQFPSILFLHTWLSYSTSKIKLTCHSLRTVYDKHHHYRHHHHHRNVVVVVIIIIIIINQYWILILYEHIQQHRSHLPPIWPGEDELSQWDRDSPAACHPAVNKRRPSEMHGFILAFFLIVIYDCFMDYLAPPYYSGQFP